MSLRYSLLLKSDSRTITGLGQDAAAIAQSGTEADLFALVSATGRALRERLGVTESSATTVRGVRAALPATVEATRLYAEGLEKQRALDGPQREELAGF